MQRKNDELKKLSIRRTEEISVYTIISVILHFAFRANFPREFEKICETNSLIILFSINFDGEFSVLYQQICRVIISNLGIIANLT